MWRVAKVHESPRLCVDASGSVIALVISRFCHLEFLQLFVWLPSNARWVQVASCNINSKGQYPCLWGTGVLIWLIISHGSAQVPWHIRPRLVKKTKMKDKMFTTPRNLLLYFTVLLCSMRTLWTREIFRLSKLALVLFTVCLMRKKMLQTPQSSCFQCLGWNVLKLVVRGSFQKRGEKSFLIFLKFVCQRR